MELSVETFFYDSIYLMGCLVTQIMSSDIALYFTEMPAGANSI